MKKFCLYIASLLTLSACQYGTEHPEHKAEMTVESFATAYFNYDFKEAMKFVTDDSKKWIYYAASNINEKDIDLLREAANDAVVNIDSSEIHKDGTVYITVFNTLKHDSIGTISGKFVKKASYRIHIVNEGHWKVKMEGLLKSEM